MSYIKHESATLFSSPDWTQIQVLCLVDTLRCSPQTWSLIYIYIGMFTENKQTDSENLRFSVGILNFITHIWCHHKHSTHFDLLWKRWTYTHRNRFNFKFENIFLEADYFFLTITWHIHGKYNNNNNITLQS